MNNPKVVKLNILKGGNDLLRTDILPGSDGKPTTINLDPRLSPFYPKEDDPLNFPDELDTDESYIESNDPSTMINKDIQKGGFVPGLIPIPLGKPQYNPFDTQVISNPLAPLKPLLQGTLPNPHKTTMTFQPLPVVMKVRNPIVKELNKLKNILENTKKDDKERIEKVKNRVNNLIRRLNGEKLDKIDDVKSYLLDIVDQIKDLLNKKLNK